MHYGARYYLPGLRRFISADSIVPDPGNSQSLNRYSYVENKPLTFNDPSGHSLCRHNFSCGSKPNVRVANRTIQTINFPRSSYATDPLSGPYEEVSGGVSTEAESLGPLQTLWNNIQETFGVGGSSIDGGGPLIDIPLVNIRNREKGQVSPSPE